MNPKRLFSKGTFLKSIVSALGVSVLAQLIGLVRQILVAAYFGVSRGLDIYFMTFAIATLIVFSFGVIFDTISIPHLVKAFEERGKRHFQRLTGSLFSFSVVFALFLTTVFFIAVPIAIKIMAIGFSQADKFAVRKMAVYFLPWVFVSIPYYTLCSFYKSVRSFTIVFLGEVVISFVSLAFLFIFHRSTHLLPIAYFAGYCVAFLMLFSLSFGQFRRIGNIFAPEMKKFYKNFIELFGANQIGSLSSIVEKFLQSFLPIGGISVLAYSSQITANMAGLLSFRDIFVVPLSSSHRRAEKLERAVIGLALIAVPVMFFVSYFASDITSILFKRGKFDSGAATLMASTLSVYAFSLAPGVIGIPAFRTFQVIDRIRNTGLVYLLTTVSFAVFGAIFVFLLKLGTCGMAITVVVTGYLANALSFFLLARNGVRIDFIRVAKYLGYATLTSIIIASLVKAVPGFFPRKIANFTFSGLIYFTAICGAYIPISKRISFVVLGAV